MYLYVSQLIYYCFPWQEVRISARTPQRGVLFEGLAGDVPECYFTCKIATVCVKDNYLVIEIWEDYHDCERTDY